VVNITYSECVSVALGIQHPVRVRHVVICVLSESIILLHIILLNGTIFEKKNILNVKCVF